MQWVADDLHVLLYGAPYVAPSNLVRHMWNMHVVAPFADDRHMERVIANWWGPAYEGAVDPVAGSVHVPVAAHGTGVAIQKLFWGLFRFPVAKMLVRWWGGGGCVGCWSAA